MIGNAHCTAILSSMAIALLAAFASSSRGQPQLLPAAAGGWIRADTVAVYAGKDLFRLVDGGADLFFEYGFVRALASEYSHLPNASAATELYEMESPAAAYGLFTSFTAGTGTAVPVGQEAVMGEGYCIFWKGRYVGMLTAASVDSATTTILAELAAEMAKQIHDAGPLPPICALLRNHGLNPRTMVFLRGKLALGNHLPHPWGASLPATDGVVGTSGTSSYLILEYAGAAPADIALRAASLEWQRLFQEF